MQWRIFGLAAVVAATLVGRASAVRVDYDLGVISKYVWRGMTVTDGPVFQPDVTVLHNSGFAVDVWGNVDLNDVNGYKGELNEIDLTLYFERGETVIWSFGFVEYVFPNTLFPDTRELFASVGNDGLASADLTVYYDIGEVDDFYATLSVGYDLEFNEYWTSALSVSAGLAGSRFVANYSGGEKSGFHDINATLSVSFSRSYLTAILLGGYTDTLNGDVLPEQAADFWAGTRVVLSF